MRVSGATSFKAEGKQKLRATLKSVWQKKTKPWGVCLKQEGSQDKYKSAGRKLNVPDYCGLSFDSGGGAATLQVQTTVHTLGGFIMFSIKAII